MHDDPENDFSPALSDQQTEPVGASGSRGEDRLLQDLRTMYGQEQSATIDRVWMRLQRHRAPTHQQPERHTEGDSMANWSDNNEKADTLMTSGTQKIGNYHLLRLLGEGGQASVYLGEHLLLKRLAAIKMLHTSLNEQDSATFLREAQLLASLTHPHIIRVHDYLVDQGKPLLVMDYAPGGTLRALHPSGQQVPRESILTYLKQITTALQYAHNRGVIHRDIKPENMLLDEHQHIMLSDFGLAFLAPQQLKMQELIGTVTYMSPEQLRGKPVFATDQYALGVIVYEWLCGESPFTGTSAGIIVQHLSTPPPSLRERRPDLPVAVEKVVLRALAKEPAQRFDNVQAFAHAFEDAWPEEPRIAPQPQTENRNRVRILAKVQAFWIDGVLAHSLDAATLLVPDLHERPDAVVRSWEAVLQEPVEINPPPLMGRNITEVFDRVAGELLILGRPGSGKTTLLLELARDLVERAEKDSNQLIPVIFNLVSWARKQQTLEDWLVEELNSKYQVPRKLGQQWIAQDQILPLLDGLDEVTPQTQSACVEAINTYRGLHGLLPLVVCCRTDDYFAQRHHLHLSRAVEIQPLTPAQIDTYLATFGQNLEPVCQALHRDAELLEFASSPLMLHILAQTYQEGSIADFLEADNPSLRQQRLFETYVTRMLKRRGRRPPCSPEQTIHWLARLAGYMCKHDQTVFYIERLQPDWLSDRRGKNFYQALALRFPAMLLGGLIGAFIGGLFVLGRLSQDRGDFLVLSQTTAESCLLGILLGWLFTARNAPGRVGIAWGQHLKTALIVGGCGLLLLVAPDLLMGFNALDWTLMGYISASYGLGFGLVGLLVSLLLSRQWMAGGWSLEGRWSWGRIGRVMRQFGPGHNTLVCALAGAIYGFVTMLGSGSLFLNGQFGYTFAQMLSFGTSFGVVGLLVSVLIQEAKTEEIRPAEAITWSWGSLLQSFLRFRHAGYALLIGFAYGLPYGLLGLLFGGGSLVFWSISVLSIIGIVGLVSWLLAGLLGSWSSQLLDERRLVKPNEGIRRSALYAVLFGALSWFVYGGITWLVRELASFTPLTQWILPDTWLNSWFSYGLPGAFAIALTVGGWACLKHVILCWRLRKAGEMPRNYARFLDYAAERVLLRKVGGGYIFVHRLLLDYFASLEHEDEA